MTEKIAVLGLGYVGLPVALACARHYPHTLGFDINQARIAELQRGEDRTNEADPAELHETTLRFSHNADDLASATFYIVTVPTPIDADKRPDLTPLQKASQMLGRYIKKGDVVVFESTVYPGVTEEYCGPIMAKISGLRQGVDFKLGYSPERINPGDKQHTLERVVKVVSGEDGPTLERVSVVYESFVKAGVHRAPSIKVAEAAKVIENVQRDLNIALMNELALIFDRIGIRTRDVLKASGTKWNFLPFTPGLVGGHCIGVDPYYLTTKAENLGYHPEVILAGRRINDSMGSFVAQRMIKMLIKAGIPVSGSRIGILGLTFKENVPDLRNSRVPDILRELSDFGLVSLVHDPLVTSEEAHEEYGLHTVAWEELRDLDGLILAVSHKEYLQLPLEALTKPLREGGVIVDVKSALDPQRLPKHIHYWSL